MAVSPAWARAADPTLPPELAAEIAWSSTPTATSAVFPNDERALAREVARPDTYIGASGLVVAVLRAPRVCTDGTGSVADGEAFIETLAIGASP